MAVLFVQKDFIKSGGIERVNTNLARAFTDLGTSVVFYIMNGNHCSEEGYSALSMQFQTERNLKEDSLFKKLSTLRTVIKKHQIKTIISATEQANILTFLVASTVRNVDVIYTRHVAFDASDQKLPAWSIKLLYSLYVTNGNVVTVSKALRDEVKQNVLWCKSRVFFVPNAVVGSHMLTAATRENRLKPANDYFIAVGRLVEQKGFDLLLHSYANALQVDDKLPTLLIIGEGEDKALLENMANDLGVSEKVVFGGFTDNPYSLIKDAMALILSSRHEGMPTVIIESMSLNTPVIAFDCPTGPSEIIKTGKNGILVEHLNTGLLTDAITKYKTLDFSGLETFVSEFVFENVAKRYLEVAREK